MKQKINMQQFPDKVEFIRRSKNNINYDFYLNHRDKNIELKIPEGKYEDLVTKRITERALTLEKYGIAILKKIGHHE